MNCQTAKRFIRQSLTREAKDHMVECEDCRRFAADFGILKDGLREIDFPADEAGAIVDRMMPKLRRELRMRIKADRVRARKNAMAAALVAILFAPLAVALNYGIASGGDALFSRLFFPAAGSLFFGGYVFCAAVVFGFAYGSIPIVLVASRARLR